MAALYDFSFSHCIEVNVLFEGDVFTSSCCDSFPSPSCSFTEVSYSSDHFQKNWCPSGRFWQVPGFQIWRFCRAAEAKRPCATCCLRLGTSFSQKPIRRETSNEISLVDPHTPEAPHFENTQRKIFSCILQTRQTLKECYFYSDILNYNSCSNWIPAMS